MGNSLGVLFPSSQTRAEQMVISFLLSMGKNQEITIQEIANHVHLTPSCIRKFIERGIMYQSLKTIVLIRNYVKIIDKR